MLFPKTKKLAGITMISSAFLFYGCSSSYTMVAPTPPENYEVIGKTQGSATGSLGIVSTAYYAIPMGLNSRTERAYARALSNAPGATGLIDVTYDESWAWWLIGTARTVTVQGTAIKEIKE